MTLSINWRRITQLGIDALLSAVSAYAAFCLRMAEFPLSHWWMPVYLSGLGSLIGWRLLSLLGLRVYRIASRHTGIRDLEVIFLATLLSSVLFWTSAHLLPQGRFPKSILIIDWFVNFFLVAGLRVAYRIALDVRRLQARSRSGPPARRVLILGAGTMGASLAREMRWRSSGDLTLVGFLDDDPAKRGLLLHGAPVLGPILELRRIVSQRAVDDVIVAIPSATGPRVREIIALCEDLPVRLRISPGFAELENGDGWRTLRDVSVEDLLRRKPVRVNLQEITAYLAGERVLVTGAGGSIGSELVRQIIRVGPKEILLLGHGENSIFEIEQELRRELDYTPTCLIADTRDYDRLLMLFERHRPTVVFHAAAHKHVPLMESNAAEAITNNVLGTRNLARIASLTGVKRFVMVSTDKAVNPTSVMGASKRVAELLIQAESRRGSTEFAIVRFGNVLGSRGSVVPLMRKQIEHGGPVTVTHPQVVRYFMTIPEAVQLLVQAGALGGRGAIYVLDMGEPVRILDLARDLIRLSGLVPGKDIAVRITGLRPGEKLYEEMLTAQEGVSVTRHERIFCAPASEFSISHLEKAVDALVAAARADDTDEMRRLLKVLEPGFALPAAPPIEPAVVGSYHRSGDDSAALGSAQPGEAARVKPAAAKREYTQPGITRPGYAGPPTA